MIVRGPPQEVAFVRQLEPRGRDFLDDLVASLPEEIARLDAVLADAGLYARDRATFDRTMKAAEAARSKLEAAEEEWLALEEKRESLGG